MDGKYREIRDRYHDEVFGVTDHQMSRDISSLLQYIDQLHHLAAQAADRAVQAAFAALEDGDPSHIH